MAINFDALYDALKNKRRHLAIRTIFKSPSNTGIITRTTSSGEVITEERPVERQSRTGEDLTPEPLFGNHPNKYANKKKCVCPQHEGDRWVNRGQFSADRRHSDGLQAWCKDCRNRHARFAYVPRWKRGV